MSTYSGNAQIVEIKAISASIGPAGTIYTVPSGRFAEVQLIEVVSAGAGFSFEVAGSTLVGTIEATVLDSGDIIGQYRPILLTDGDTITGEDASYRIRIKEFNNP